MNPTSTKLPALVNNWLTQASVKRETVFLLGFEMCIRDRNNLLKPSDGGPVAVPSQDMVLGIYYLTQERPGYPGEGKFFKSVNEAILAYENKVITPVSYTHLFP